MNESTPTPADEATAGQPKPAVASSAYVATVARRFIARMWWTALPFVGLFAWGLTHDIRFALLGLMALLIVFPMLGAFAIMRHCASPRIAARSASTSFTVADGHIVCFADSVGNGGSAIRRELDSADIKNVARRGSTSVVATGRGIADFAIVPDSAIDPESLDALLALNDKDYTSAI